MKKMTYISKIITKKIKHKIIIILIKLIKLTLLKILIKKYNITSTEPNNILNVSDDDE